MGEPSGLRLEARSVPGPWRPLLAALIALLAMVACGDGDMDPVEPPANQAPIATGAIPPQTVTVGAAVEIRVSDYFSDPDGDALTFAAQTSDAGVATASVSGATATLSGVGQGAATVTVTATDPSGQSAQQGVSVTVPNRAPMVVDSIGNVIVDPGDTVFIDLVDYFSDPDGDALTYAAETSDTAVAAVSVSDDVAILSGVAKGAATIEVTATDPSGQSAQQGVSVTVPNRAPMVVDSIGNVIVDPGDSVFIDLVDYFSDPDGDALTYAAETSDTAVAAVSVSDDVAILSGVAKGAATIEVTATDPAGQSTRLGGSVTVRNQAPVPVDSIGRITLEVGDSVSIDLTEHFADLDGDSLTFAAKTSDTAIATVFVSGAVATLSGAAKGAARMTVTATDPDGLTAQQRVPVTVPNQAPIVVDSIRRVTMDSGDSVSIDLTERFADPDGDSLTFATEVSDETVATVAVVRGIMSIQGRGGSIDVRVTATDTEAAFVAVSFPVRVNNEPPELIAAIPNDTLKETQSLTVQLRAHFRDPEGQGLTYSASTADTALAHVSVANGVLTVTAIEEGVARITVAANDVGGLSLEQGLDVTIHPATDREVLHALYHATDGPSWKRRHHWLSDLPLRSWEGVVADSSGRVTLLHLQANNLNGTIPSAIGRLANLTSLNLSRNDLRGPIPSAIGNLVDLTSLDLGNNHLSGHLPHEIGRLGNLEIMKLNHNDVSGPLPVEIGDMKNLRTLDLRVNDFIGSIPLAIAELTQLRYLGLSANLFTGRIPAAFGRLSSLRGLEVGYNRLTGPIPTGIGRIATLETLRLGGNQLTGTIPTEIGRLSTLETLELGGNLLTGTIPTEIGRLSRLRYFDVAHNDLTGPIPTWLGSLSWLAELRLNGNQLTGTIPTEIGRLSSLRHFDVARNDLTGPIPTELGSLSRLDALRLDGNQLTGTIPGSLGNLSVLRVLSLNGNQLTGTIPASLGNMLALHWLDLAGNQLTGSIPDSLGNLSALNLLLLAGNQLTGSIPAWLGNLSALHSLVLSQNQLTGSIPASLGNLSALSLLQVSSNPDLTGALPRTFLMLTALRSLRFESTKVCAPDDDEFRAWLEALPDGYRGTIC